MGIANYMIEQAKYLLISWLIAKKQYKSAIAHIDLLLSSTTSIRKCVNLKVQCLIEIEDYEAALQLYQDYHPFAISDKEDIRALKYHSELYGKIDNQIQKTKYAISHQVFSRSGNARETFISDLEEKSLPVYKSFHDNEVIDSRILESIIIDNLQMLRIAEASAYVALANRLNIEITDHVSQEFLVYSQARDFADEINNQEENLYCIITDSTKLSRNIQEKCLVKTLSFLGKKVFYISPENINSSSFSEHKGAVLKNEFNSNVVIKTIQDTKSSYAKNITVIIKNVLNDCDDTPVLLFGESGLLKQLNEDVDMRKRLEMYFRHFEEQPLPRMDCLLLGNYLSSVSKIWNVDAAHELHKDPEIDFSIVIPVRNSVKYLREVIDTCLNQEYAGSWEVLVSDNGWHLGPDVENLVKSINNNKIRYIKTPHDLSLTKSFEYAFLNARGSYVLSIGSDDGLIKDALSIMKKAFDQYPHNSVVFWPFAWYYWPKFPANDALVNKLQYTNNYPTRGLVSEIESKPLIRGYATGRIPFFDLPMMYLASCVSREHIRKIIEVSGKLHDGVSQDIYTGLVNLFMEDKITYLNIPLVIVGSSDIGVGLDGEKAIQNYKALSARLKSKYRYYRYNNYHSRQYRNILPTLGLGPKHLVFREYIKVSNIFELDYLERGDIIRVMRAIHDWLPASYGEKAIYYGKLRDIAMSFGIIVYLQYMISRMIWYIASKIRRNISKIILPIVKNILGLSTKINKVPTGSDHQKLLSAENNTIQEIDIDLSHFQEQGIKAATVLLSSKIHRELSL